MKNWFNSLKVSQKLVLISVFFIMPDSLMLYLFITGINANIQFARMEKKGNEYQRLLEELLKFIPQHRMLALRSLRGEPQAVDEVSRKQAQIGAAFEALAAVDARIGVELQFTDEGLAKRKREHYRIRTVRKEWQDLKARLAGLKPEASAEQHLHLVTDVRTMITHAGDLSNLILDPDLDSYYLMDASLLALPQTQDRLANVMAYGETVLRQQNISNEERAQLAIHATLLKEMDLDRISSSVQTALNEDPNFCGTSATLHVRVPPALKEYTSAAQAFINVATRLVRSEKIEVTTEEYLAAGHKAREASFELWKIASEELDTLLQKRIEYYDRRRSLSLMVAALALLAAVTFVTFITRSISGPLRQQASDLTAANQALQGQIVERNRAEEGLRRSEAQLAAAQIIARIGSWEWDVGTNKMIWSDENYRIHGFEPREFEVSYETTLEFIHPQERGFSDEAIRKSLAAGKPFSFEQRVLRVDGTERVIHQRGDVVLDPEGRVAKMFGTAQDVTERRRAEDELEKVHKQLLDTSRQAGMAEVATAILHNVGNVLNSVSVSSTLVADLARKSKVPYLAKVTALLREHAADLGDFLTNDPKGKQFPGYLGQLAAHLTSEQETVLKEIELVKKNIEHIKDIVATQQSFAKVSGLTELVNVADLVEDALRMNASSLARHDVQIVRQYEPLVPEINVEKHKVLQIMVNLIRNAKNACDESGRADKQVTLRVANGDGQITIAVIDNGVGIPPENLTRIFNHGFTTKKDGHGFGLHSGALAAKQMDGSLNVHSGGPGQGAMFTVTLPLHAPQRAHE